MSHLTSERFILFTTDGRGPSHTRPMHPSPSTTRNHIATLFLYCWLLILPVGMTAATKTASYGSGFSSQSGEDTSMEDYHQSEPPKKSNIIGRLYARVTNGIHGDRQPHHALHALCQRFLKVEKSIAEFYPSASLDRKNRGFAWKDFLVKQQSDLGHATMAYAFALEYFDNLAWSIGKGVAKDDFNEADYIFLIEHGLSDLLVKALFEGPYQEVSACPMGHHRSLSHGNHVPKIEELLHVAMVLEEERFFVKFYELAVNHKSMRERVLKTVEFWKISLELGVSEYFYDVQEYLTFEQLHHLAQSIRNDYDRLKVKLADKAQMLTWHYHIYSNALAHISSILGISYSPSSFSAK